MLVSADGDHGTAENAVKSIGRKLCIYVNLENRMIRSICAFVIQSFRPQTLKNSISMSCVD